MTRRPIALTLLVVAFLGAYAIDAQRPGGGPGAPTELDAFKGVTADGTVQPGLCAIRSTGVTTRPVMDAASQFLTSPILNYFVLAQHGRRPRPSEDGRSAHVPAAAAYQQHPH